jgi:hypothetical protein
MKNIIRQVGDKMHIFIIYLRKSAYFKFSNFQKKDYIDDIRNLGVPKSSTPQNTSKVIFIVTKVTKPSFQASSNKFYCNNAEV